MKIKLLGRLGVWLCDRFYPRPATLSEAAQSSQYAHLMVEVLRGNCRYYGRDRAADHEPIISERRDYDKIYGRKSEAK